VSTPGPVRARSCAAPASDPHLPDPVIHLVHETHPKHPTQIHPTQIHPTQIHPTQIHPTIHPTHRMGANR